MIIGEGGTLHFRVTQDLSGSVRSGLKVDALLPTVNAVLHERLLSIMEAVRVVQQRALSGQNMATGGEGSIAELLTSLGDLCYDVADTSSEIEDALGHQDDGEPNAAAYLLTRAKATMLGSPVCPPK